MAKIQCWYRGYLRIADWWVYLSPIVDLGTRLFIARVFFMSGLTKINDWAGTLYLFNNEYNVPVLSPTIAAYMATAGELGLSVLLVLGFGRRFAAAGLFILNVVAAISFPDLSEAGHYQHLCWGIMLGLLLVYSGPEWGVDAWVRKCLSKDSNACKKI